jgi:AcrR family transcriptional regulator
MKVAKPLAKGIVAAKRGSQMPEPEPAAEQGQAPSPRQPRKLSRDARRQQLIEATIEVLSSKGYARMTLSDVARQAGLSHGLVNFHFQSKEKLLAETLGYLAEEYLLNWTGALAEAGPDAASRLEAMLRADFNPAICTPARLAAWCSFWGEATSRPFYQQLCGEKDNHYNEVLQEICARLIAENGYDLDPLHTSRVLRVTVEGIWLDQMTMSAPYSREEGQTSAFTCAAAFFPRHFTPAGRIRDRQ